MSQTLSRSIGQMKKTSKTAITSPVKVLTKVLLGSFPLDCKNFLKATGR